jgi:predicted transcriptional regulator
MSQEHRITFRLNDDLMNILERYAKHSDLTLSEAIRQAVSKLTRK